MIRARSARLRRVVAVRTHAVSCARSCAATANLVATAMPCLHHAITGMASELTRRDTSPELDACEECRVRRAAAWRAHCLLPITAGCVSVRSSRPEPLLPPGSGAMARDSGLARARRGGIPRPEETEAGGVPRHHPGCRRIRVLHGREPVHLRLVRVHLRAARHAVRGPWGVRHRRP